MIKYWSKELERIKQQIELLKDRQGSGMRSGLRCYHEGKQHAIEDMLDDYKVLLDSAVALTMFREGTQYYEEAKAVVDEIQQQREDL